MQYKYHRPFKCDEIHFQDHQSIVAIQILLTISNMMKFILIWCRFISVNSDGDYFAIHIFPNKSLCRSGTELDLVFVRLYSEFEQRIQIKCWFQHSILNFITLCRAAYFERILDIILSVHAAIACFCDWNCAHSTNFVVLFSIASTKQNLCYTNIRTDFSETNIDVCIPGDSNLAIPHDFSWFVMSACSGDILIEIQLRFSYRTKSFLLSVALVEAIW